MSAVVLDRLSVVNNAFRREEPRIAGNRQNPTRSPMSVQAGNSAPPTVNAWARNVLPLLRG